MLIIFHISFLITCGPFYRVRNPKNQLSQINSLTIVGCSLEYPVAKSTMKLEVQLFFSHNYALLLWTRHTICVGKPDKLCTISENCVAMPYWCKKLWATKVWKVIKILRAHMTYFRRPSHIYHHPKLKRVASVASEVLERAKPSLWLFFTMKTENFDACHPDGERSQIFSMLTA